MASIVGVHSFDEISVVIDGVEVVGFWEGDDAVSVSRRTDIGNMLTGADGSSLFSHSSDKSVTITLRLQPNSPAHGRLLERQKRQESGNLNGFPVAVSDRINGIGGTTDRAFIMTVPNQDFGTNATSREWVLVASEFEEIVPAL